LIVISIVGLTFNIIRSIRNRKRGDI